MTYAVIESGGKQYRAQAGDELALELLKVPEGKTVKLDKVLLLSDENKRWVGKPFVKGAAVKAQVLKNIKSRKVTSFKAIRREGGAKTKIGHRQKMTKVKILAIEKP